VLRVIRTFLEAVLAAIASSILVAQQVEVRKFPFVVLAISILFLAAEAILRPTTTALQELSATKSEEFREDTRRALSAALVQVAERAGSGPTDIKNFGISAFIVRRRLLHPRHGQQMRVARVRLSSTPPPSNIAWTTGKGVIGLCWETQQIIATDTAQMYDDLRECSKAEWDQLRPAVQLNLKYEEFRRIAGKYAGVVAVPIVDSRTERYRGCVALDIIHGEDFSRIDNQRIYEILSDAAVSIANYLRKYGRRVRGR
jgi:hypothetical protein